MELQRYSGNPVLAPTGNWWESKAVFNAAAVRDNGRIHLLYRAIGDDNISRFGYAASLDGYNFDIRYDNPVFEPEETNHLERLGCEDPRIAVIDGIFHITYTAASVYPAGHPRPLFSVGVPWRCRVCLAATQDFRTFQRQGCVLPDIDDKDAVLFPEKINGKFVMIHRIFPDMWISYSDDMMTWYGHKKFMEVRPAMWDSNRIGAGAPPIKTDKGWLEVYHGVDDRKHYQLGIVYLDLNDPSKVIARSRTPILRPEKDFEKNGLVSNVVFTCGMVEKDGQYLVYYGGADNSIGVATAPVDAFEKADLEWY